MACNILSALDRIVVKYSRLIYLNKNLPYFKKNYGMYQAHKQTHGQNEELGKDNRFVGS